MAEKDKGQNWSAEGYAAHARFVADLGEPLLELLAAQPFERILDLGCGDGALTAKIAESGAAVVGVDRSPELLAAARRLGLDVREADGRDLPFQGEFDAVFSNAALHWMPAADAVIAGVRRALKPGGRFVGEFGGFGNVAAIVTALVAVLKRRGLRWPDGPVWCFPTAEDYAARLEAGGFRVDRIALVPRPTALPTGMAGWLKTFAGPFVRSLTPALREEVLAEAEELLSHSLRAPDGRWIADYIRLRFAARLPAG